MKKKKSHHPFDWKSKVTDLFIVIIGITIAFKLNTWNESVATQDEVMSYLTSFSEESLSNEESLRSALEYSMASKKQIDSLKQMLAAQDYTNPRAKVHVASMMGLSNFIPLVTTMDNITASGEFGLIANNSLKTHLIETYSAYEVTTKLENLLADYTNTYLTPFFFENIRFSDFSSIHSNFISSPKFENIVFGYDVLLSQKIQGYQSNLDALTQLNEALETTLKAPNDNGPMKK